MDHRKWMYNVERVTPEYVNGLFEFIKTAEDHQAKTGKAQISCPCKECAHFICHDDIETIIYHLFKHGFTNNYTWWKHHGEARRDCNDVVLESNVNNNDDNCSSSNQNINDMLHDAEHNAELDMEKLQQLFVESEKPLYAGCTNFTKLLAVLRLLTVKVEYGLSDVGFNKLLELFNKMLPKNNELPTSTYQAKKLMCLFGLEVKRINACLKDIILYRKGYKDLHKCHVCKVSRYKDTTLTEFDEDVTKNGPAAKVLWYFPIIPRLKQLYSNPKNEKLLRWHVEDRKHDKKMRHVADASQWKNIDNHYIKFGADIRNIRFGLSSDGINAFGNMSSRHNTWPVLLCIYNLPPWLYMKRKYIMMSLLIQGPKQPGNDIDMYLEPLINDMIDLWDKGVEVYDAYKKERFKLFAMIFCTISDFPAYGNFLGYGTKGEKACPICEKDTHSRWMTNFRHSLDVMHIEKNVSESLIGLLLNIKGKTKDGINARKDMVEMGIRDELAPQEIGNKRTYLPAACYTLSKAEKNKFCQCLHDIKVPSGYSANIKKLVSMKDLKLIDPTTKKDMRLKIDKLRASHSTTREEDMVRSKCVSTKQQSQQQVNPDDEGGDDLNIADDVTQQSIAVMEKPRKKRGINKVKDLPVGESAKMRLEDDDTIKSYTLKSCGQKWRAFKNTLRNDYMLKKRCPRGTYTFLEPSVWKDFCRNEHYTEEKRKRREEVRARALKQTNRPRVGAKGFAGFEEQWEEERNDPNKATDLHKILGRGSNFCLGRRRLDKDGNLTVPPEIADIANKLVETSEQLSQGTIKAQPGADPLTIVYGQDHGGRTRGLSEKVQEKLFSGPVWNRVKEKMLEELVKEPIVGTSSVRPTTSIIRIDCIKETTTCSLFSPESILTGEKILCAHASVYPIGDGLIHGKRLRKGYMRVSVLKVLNRQEDLELPVPDEDILNLGGALNAFIQWPIGAIACFSGSPNTPAPSAAAKSTLPKIVQRPSTTECSALTNVPAITQASKKRKKTVKAPIQQSEVEKDKADIRKRLHLLKEDIDLRSEAVRNGYYRWMDREDCTMPQFVDFKKEIFRDAHDFTLPINTTDIIELLAGDKLGTNILTLFSSISNDGSSVIGDSVLLLLLIRWTGFLNPEVITADTHMDTDINVIIYLTEALKGYDFFVAPYLHNGHHVLLIICPKHGRGFILDSFKWKEKKTKEDYYLVNQVERVVGPLSWELPIDDFPNIQPWGETRSLKLSEMDAVVTAWFSLWRENMDQQERGRGEVVAWRCQRGRAAVSRRPVIPRLPAWTSSLAVVSSSITSTSFDMALYCLHVGPGGDCSRELVLQFVSTVTYDYRSTDFTDPMVLTFRLGGEDI
ncbi:hypothetical protein Tco_0671817 [Tanacetum coccineum]